MCYTIRVDYGNTINFMWVQRFAIGCFVHCCNVKSYTLPKFMCEQLVRDTAKQRFTHVYIYCSGLHQNLAGSPTGLAARDAQGWDSRADSVLPAPTRSQVQGIARDLHIRKSYRQTQLAVASQHLPTLKSQQHYISHPGSLLMPCISIFNRSF